MQGLTYLARSGPHAGVLVTRTLVLTLRVHSKAVALSGNASESATRTPHHVQIVCRTQPELNLSGPHAGVLVTRTLVLTLRVHSKAVALSG
jgi:hypothetical protein